MTGPLLTNCHILFMWFWFAKVIINTNIDHSGYHLPFIHSSGKEMKAYHVLRKFQAVTFSQNIMISTI